MRWSGRDGLNGFGEADETCAGGEEEGVRGRQTEEKAVLVVAAEQDGRGSGRIRLRRAPDVSSESRRGFIEESATPGPLVHADGWQGCHNIAQQGRAHKVTIISRSDEAARKRTPRVHRAAALLKRRLLGTHQGASMGRPVHRSRARQQAVASND